MKVCPLPRFTENCKSEEIETKIHLPGSVPGDSGPVVPFSRVVFRLPSFCSVLQGVLFVPVAVNQAAPVSGILWSLQVHSPVAGLLPVRFFFQKQR